MQSFIKTLPGFVEGFLYERQGDENQHQILTIAVWETAAAFENAKQAVAAENQRQGVNPQEVTRQLGVEFTRNMYDRSPY
jgi:heme-degrading monooxygenase HmoA